MERKEKPFGCLLRPSRDGRDAISTEPAVWFELIELVEMVEMVWMADAKLAWIAAAGRLGAPSEWVFGWEVECGIAWMV